MFGWFLTSEEFDKRLDDFFRTYQARGMKKWQGFMLSDFTSKADKIDKERAKVYEKKKPMSLESISEILMIAYANHRLVSVQLKQVDIDDKFLPDIVGTVDGYQVDHVVISGEWIELEDINNVEID